MKYAVRSLLIRMALPGFHTEGGEGAQGFPLTSESFPPPPPSQNFESLFTILYGSMVLGDFSLTSTSVCKVKMVWLV